MVTDNELHVAMSALLPEHDWSSHGIDDLYRAARVALQRRIDNSKHGGAVIAALRDAGESWAQIEQRTGIPARTARRWADPPPEA